MSTINRLCLTLVLAITPAPVLAGNNNAKTATANTASTTAADPTPAAATPSLASTTTDSNITALLGVLVMKGVLAPAEANAIHDAVPAAQFQALLDTLSRKGLVTAQDLSFVANPRPEALAPVSATLAISPAPVATAQVPSGKKLEAPPVPAIVPAVAPLRVLPVDPPVKGGLKAAFTMGPIKMTPYGFVKATAVYDDSNPNGDDMPFPGLFLNNATFATTTGPTKDPEFHVKARQARIGANFEFPDISPRLAFTGRIEGDFEGNFTEVDNRDVSSIRSSQFSLRQAWARLDYAAGENTDLYFEGGQDWTLFGSSALPNLLETTALGYWYGDIYERSPQFQFGLVQKLGGSRNLKFSPTFAIMMPTSSQIEKLGSLGVTAQLAQAEREGADSGRPELEGRLALQFQLDKAPGVAPAQIIFSGVDGRRTSIVPNSAPGYSSMPANYLAAFPNGFTASSNIYGVQGAVQLPTRWFTLVASAYRGGDLRFFFAGQVNSYATDTSGLSNIQGPFATLDGGPLAAAGGAVLGTNASGQVVVAPQRAIRTFGGFVNLGLPLSRWFNANPKGRNAGWQLYLHMGKDQVPKWDLTYPGYSANANVLAPLPLLMGKLSAATVYYKANPYITFGFEQSIYATRLIPGLTYTIAGKPSNEWQDHRTEFGPIFTF
ncbi:MAG TPA: hypothetical protein VMU61_14845 [Candidatus Aquilonibacter sp.]|nr:hypothetical protein [Candidatus Aquilonibacter sp.]